MEWLVHLLIQDQCNTYHGPMPIQILVNWLGLQIYYVCLWKQESIKILKLGLKYIGGVNKCLILWNCFFHCFLFLYLQL